MSSTAALSRPELTLDQNSTGTNSSPTPTSTTPSAFYPPLMGTMGDSGETTPTRTIAPLQTNFDYRDLHPDIGTAYVTSEPPSSISSHTNPSSLSSPSVSNDHHMRKHSRSEEDQKPSTSTTGLTRRRKSSPKDADSVRAVYLEKNRLAASKCRNRQKKQEEKLVEKGRAVERINKGLKSEVDFLKESMRYLMEDVSRHQTCSDNRLATYVQRRADRLAIGDVPTTVKREEEEDGLNSDPNMKAVEEEDGEE
ncbi:hypothetical protein K491DRAFT_159243 [Lophiostoma macrostomum CBS 122681]|uniref:BZIP domain-containing protein n=1 Tax=Lophiostoma macrostomum CBS 122681 TaxID=1314788 RepID=A0A6A6STX1_9PLEO|nr:hypothetical protein K491DRAFT_159243 [Lophiostoma macrostomum CBS 122681]